jgi:hypothetical protein
MAKSLLYTVTRTTVFNTLGGHATDVLAVAESHSAGVSYARKLCDKYYAGVIYSEREVGWGKTQIELVVDKVTTRITVEPVARVTHRTTL